MMNWNYMVLTEFGWSSTTVSLSVGHVLGSNNVSFVMSAHLEQKCQFVRSVIYLVLADGDVP